MPDALSGRRILVVEDEILVALLLQDMLADLGGLVIGPASTVDEALVMITTEDLDAAVLDVNLNGQMSYPVADTLIARGVPFLFSSGYASNRLQEGYRAHPALQKPYHTSELRAVLTGLIAPATPDALRPAPAAA